MERFRIAIIASFMFCLATVSESFAGAVLYVDDSAVGANNGSNWCDAYRNLQDALGAARMSGGAISEIHVAQGAYRPDRGTNQNRGNRAATFQLIDHVALRGGYAGCSAPDPDARDIANHATVLSGDLSGNDAPLACAHDSPDCDSFGKLCVDNECIVRRNSSENSYHVVDGSSRGATAVLDGFTVMAGNANGTSELSQGGGMYNYFGRPTITNCTFSGNWAGGGGGGIYNDHRSPAVTHCTFRGNSALVGGGMLTFSGSPTVIDCTFDSNSALSGGGMFNNLDSPRVIDCTFSGNLAYIGDGGGMHNNLSSPIVTNCRFIGNSAGDGGGGMYNNLESPVLTNCTFSGNSANVDGGGIYNTSYDDTGSPSVTNCTFIANSAKGIGGGVYNNASFLTLTNSILWGNVEDADGNGGGPFTGKSAQIHTDSGGSPVVNYSIVQGGWSGAGGIGIFDTDPMLVDPDGADGVPGTLDDNLHLAARSPAIDAGDNVNVPPDVDDLDHDFDIGERLPLDLDRQPRFVEDSDTMNTGNGIRPIVDMGAFEFQPDCNRNGVRDERDAADGTSVDCNENGRPDECEVDVQTTAPGGPYFCRFDCDLDCDANGTPDECQVPQFGQVTSNWIDGVGLWSHSPNRAWCLPEAPGSNGNARFDVEIPLPQSVVTLNVSPTIDTLSIGAGAALVVGENSGAAVRTLLVTDEVGITNRGTIRVRDRRRFIVDAQRINQSDDGCDGGVLEAVDGDAAVGDEEVKSILEISHARIERGTLRTVGEYSEIHLIGGAELVDVCVRGVVIPDGQVGRFSEDVVNDGLIRVAPHGLEQAYFAPGVIGGTLRGNGGNDDCVRLGGRSAARLGDLKASFTNGLDHRIEGGGVVFGGMDNKGMVRANMAGTDGALLISPPGEKVNDGTFMASDGGLLRILDDVSGNGAIVADGGTIEVGAPDDALQVEGRSLLVAGDEPSVLEVGPGATVMISEGATVGPRGRLGGITAPGAANGSILVRKDLTVNQGDVDVDPADAPGIVDIDGDMLLDISGDLVLDGRDAEMGICNQQLQTAAVRGAHTPPVVRVRDKARVKTSSVVIRAAGTIMAAGEGGIDVAMDLENRSVRPDCFDLRMGRVRATGAAQQTFEVAGRDVGPSFDGFQLAGHTNFSIGRLEVLSGREVVFDDRFNNSPNSTAGLGESEALYVQTLMLGPGSHFTIESGTVYYLYLVGDASAACSGGCDRLIRIGCDGPNRDGQCDRADLKALKGCIAQSGPGGVDAVGCSAVDFDFDGDVDLFDFAVFQIGVMKP